MSRRSQTTSSTVQVRISLGEFEEITFTQEFVNLTAGRLFSGNERQVQPSTRWSAASLTTRRRSASRQKVTVTSMLRLITSH